MKRIIKSFVLVTISSFLCMSLCFINTKAQSNEYMPNDIDAYHAYLDALEINKNNLTSVAPLCNESFITENQLDWSDHQIETFNEILKQTSFNSNYHEIYKNYDNNDYQTRVVKDNSTKDVVLFEVNHINGNIKILLNGKNYILYERENSLYLKNEENEIVVSKTEEINSGVSVFALKDSPYKLSNDSQYTKDYGPYDSKNTSLVSFLDWVSTGSGIISAVHPVLGVVSIVTGGLQIAANSSAYFTSYIKYWQSMKLNEMSYVRQKERWFSKSSCSDSSHISNRTKYFYSSRPS